MQDLAVQLLAVAGLLHGRFGVRRVNVGEVLLDLVIVGEVGEFLLDLAVQMLAAAGLMHGCFGVCRVVVSEVLPRFQVAGAPRWYTLTGDQTSSYCTWAAQVNVRLHLVAYDLLP
jgi:hypothetical protein